MNKYVGVAIVVLFFLILSSISISNYIVDVRYKQASGINMQMEELINLTDDEVLKEKMVALNEEIKFIQAVCFK
ncbi:MAG TPA: hypothetical protein VJH97_07425 [Candidatus Nanoarchaeia archaeon]|nr:hypothetical protein [Candidatus Nanoarchaeia archaeon]